MRILVIGTNVPSPENPMNGIFEYNQAKALQEAGHEVIYAAVDIRSIWRRRRFGIQHDNNGGMPSYVISIPMGRLPMRVLQRATLVGLLILFRHIYGRHPLPQIIHSHFLLVGSAAATLSRVKGIPLVHTEHSSHLMESPLNKTVRALALETYRQSDRVITVSPALRDNIRSEVDIESVVVPNIVNTSLFHNRRSRHPGFRIITVGNLVPVKQMDMTIRAFAQSISHLDAVSLTIVGEGPERRTLEQLASALGLTRKIYFAGKRDQRYISERFAGSDLFILASRKETFGVVFIEALASGLPIIATKCGGPEHFLTKENSIAVDPDDLEGLTNGIMAAYNGQFTVDSHASSVEAKSMFAPSTISGKLTEIFNNVLAELN